MIVKFLLKLLEHIRAGFIRYACVNTYRSILHMLLEIVLPHPIEAREPFGLASYNFVVLFLSKHVCIIYFCFSTECSS